MINNRQPGRRRGRGGNNNNGPRQGGGQQGNGSRIDSRARGNATQLHEKYKNMAADAQRSGDRVATEYYLQHADHYFRVLSEQRGRLDEQQPNRGRDAFDLDGDDEFGDEGEPIRGNEQDAARAEMREGGSGDRSNDRGQDRQRDDRPQRDDRSYDRQREDRPQRDDRPQREDRANGRDDRPRADREVRRDGNGDARPRGEWQERPRERRPEQPPVEIAAQRRAEPLGASESLEGRAEEVLEADRPLDPPAPRRRGRPPRQVEPAAEAAGFDHVGLEADRLPPSLTMAANDAAPVEAKPRRRRVRPAEDTPNAAE
ncbi:DUF4167 domain-containing protein [Sphingomonas sp.]|uniref:DUF4167 domain-containing protein n=1 Tax=Sphingomonas sp. TaxID=28214 RepID=UPI002D7E61CA|nr:DUF4167 domain-containing protein [Sphingomonas sp.]HEU0044188.1 DUF4167 domain-containing protein [Sphingomonas sp.]